MMHTKHLRIPSLAKALTLGVLLFSAGLLTPIYADSNVTVLDNSNLNNRPVNKDLDVVLVMDSSGSMKKTDPRELRKPAAKLFISLLGDNDRVSVVSFSDQGYPVTYLTPVKGEKNRQQLFKAVDRISSKGVYTNLHGAIEGALRVIDRDAAHNKAAQQRQHVIVLMSDGKMDLGNIQQNQQQTERLMLDTLPALKRQGIEVHTIAFTPQSDQTLLKKIADATGGSFNISRTDRDLHDVYTAIFEQNKSPNILPFHGEKFSIDKAIREVTIVGSKDSPQVVLSLLSPDGRMITVDDKGKDLKWFVSEQFDLITITNPARGEWRLKASAGKNKAYVITDLKQQLVIEPRKPALNEGVLIKTWLEDKGAALNKPSILQTLSVKMHVDTPDGQTHVLALEPERTADGTLTNSGAFTSLIALPAEGAYHFKVIATTNTFSREKDSIVHAVMPPPAAQPVKPEPAPQPMVESKPEASPVQPATPNTAVEQAAETKQQPAADTTDATAKTATTAKKEKPKAEKKTKNKTKEKKTAESKQKKDKHKDSKPQETKHEDGGSSILTAILIFLGINVMLGAVGGGAYFFIRRKHNKAAADEDAGETDAEAGKADVKGADKANKAA
jgi:uncharacterized protein (TIGR03503 family)